MPVHLPCFLLPTLEHEGPKGEEICFLPTVLAPRTAPLHTHTADLGPKVSQSTFVNRLSNVLPEACVQGMKPLTLSWESITSLQGPGVTSVPD